MQLVEIRLRVKNLIHETTFIQVAILFVSISIDIYWAAVMGIYYTKKDTLDEQELVPEQYPNNNE